MVPMPEPPDEPVIHTPKIEKQPEVMFSPPARVEVAVVVPTKRAAVVVPFTSSLELVVVAVRPITRESPIKFRYSTIPFLVRETEVAA